jgi:transposase
MNDPKPMQPNDVESLLARNAFLEEENRHLRALLFGRSSEKAIPPGPTSVQPHLPFDGKEAPPLPPPPEPKTSVAAHTRRKAGRGALPPELERERRVHDLLEHEKTCGHPCNCPLERIGEEVSERLDYKPAKVVVIQDVRIKYAPPASCQGVSVEAGPVKAAALPPQIVPHGIATAGMVAHVAVAKIADGVPLYRQEQQLLRLGVRITRATLCNWLIIAAMGCQRLLALMREALLDGPVINMDETHLQVLGEPGRSNTSKSFMWVCRGGPPGRPVILFRYDASRSGRVAEEILAGYRGYLQTDGYRAYEAVGERPGIRHLGCLAHVRRKFVEVEKAAGGPVTGGVAHATLDLIRKVYLVEKNVREGHLEPEEIVVLRERESRPQLEALKDLLDFHVARVPEKSLLGKAISYALGQWPRLTVFLENGNLRPDNNWAENAIRPFVVGRKNWLFSGSPEGAKAGATLYSLVETAKANGLEPFSYLRHVFEVIPGCTTDDEVRSLLPWNVDRSKLKPQP